MDFLAKPLENLQNWIAPRKRVYAFHEGSSADTQLLGNKGVGLCEMTRMGLPVPAGFIVTTEAALEYFDTNGVIPDNFVSEYTRAVQDLERKTGRTFGVASEDFPLLLSVRSGAAISLPVSEPKGGVPTGHYHFSLPESYCLPGIQPTVLNIGMNDAICESLCVKAGRRFSLDTYARHLMSYGTAVLGAQQEEYINLIQGTQPSELTGYTVADLQDIVEKFKRVRSVPIDPWVQLRTALESVFASWFSTEARKFRMAMDLPVRVGTAACVQSMVYGNRSHHSGSGYCFSRNPCTGEKGLFGEFVFNAEGEEAVNHTRSTVSINELRELEPQIVKELFYIMKKLEDHYHDMQDIEFVVEDCAVRVLQTRPAKRTAKASVRVAVDMVRELLLTERAALMNIDADKMDYFAHEELNLSACADHVLASGYPASHGAVCGKLAFTKTDVDRILQNGDTPILVRSSISAADSGDVKQCGGVLTLEGDLNSGEAVLSRALGVVCITGVGQLVMGTVALGDSLETALLIPNGPTLVAGADITLDGSSGLVYAGKVPAVAAAADKDFQTVLGWADAYRHMRVMATVHSQADLRQAAELSRTDGLGCLRSDYLFHLNSYRRDLTRAILLSDSADSRAPLLAEMLELQKNDLKEVFRMFPRRRVSVCLLEESLESVLVGDDEDLADVAVKRNMSVSQLRSKMDLVGDANPLMGLRGCRISAIMPWLTEMQVQAIVSAAVEIAREGIAVFPDICIPMVVADLELQAVVTLIHNAAKSVFDHYGPPAQGDSPIIYSVGLMVDTPRTCLQAESLCEGVSFHCFDVDGLTQLCFGLSRVDSHKFLPTYMLQKLLQSDPFRRLDERGVGVLVSSSIAASRQVCPGLRSGALLTDHARDSSSVKFFHKLGLEYVSCSPKHVPMVKIAAAQAHIAASTKPFFFGAIPPLSLIDDAEPEFYDFIH